MYEQPKGNRKAKYEYVGQKVLCCSLALVPSWLVWVLSIRCIALPKLQFKPIQNSSRKKLTLIEKM